jgi:P-type E1-E2 ATPase
VGDVVLVEAGDTIPSDGEVIEGIASVNEAAITVESAPVIRESGGDRSAVTGGTQVLSDWIKVRITVDGLKGFPEAITSVFPRTVMQTCIVHLIRNSLAFVLWKDRKGMQSMDT